MIAAVTALVGWGAGYGMAKARLDGLVDDSKSTAIVLRETSKTLQDTREALAAVTSRLEEISARVDRSETRIHDIEVRR